MNKTLYKVWRQLTADKKRFGLMLSLAAVGLLLWGRLILLEKVPRIATADPDATEQTDAPALPPRPERPQVTVELPEDLAVNLFALRPDRYRLIPVAEEGEGEVQLGDPIDDEWDRREALLDEARGMTLQGVVQGHQPFALIDGVRVHVGDSVGGFVLIELDFRQRLVKLRSESFEDLVVNLRMSDG